MTDTCLKCKKHFKRINNGQKYCTKKCQRHSKKHIKYDKKYSYIHSAIKKQLPMDRYCLRCDVKFRAIGRFNRLCAQCRRFNG